MSNLRLLGVVRADGRLDFGQSEAICVALDLAADSFSVLGRPSFWAPVATLPSELRDLLRPPPLRQTAGVLLDLVDRVTDHIRVATPFVDPQVVELLSGPLVGAGRRGVNINVVTSTGHAMHFSDLASNWSLGGGFRGRLRVTEVRTHLTLLGSHAKVVVVTTSAGKSGRRI